MWNTAYIRRKPCLLYFRIWLKQTFSKACPRHAQSAGELSKWDQYPSDDLGAPSTNFQIKQKKRVRQFIPYIILLFPKGQYWNIKSFASSACSTAVATAVSEYHTRPRFPCLVYPELRELQQPDYFRIILRITEQRIKSRLNYPADSCPG